MEEEGDWNVSGQINRLNELDIRNSKARGSSVDSFNKTAAFLRYTLSKR